MNKSRFPKLLVVIISWRLVFSCAKEEELKVKESSDDTTKPTIISVHPSEGQDNVSIFDNISIIFSEEIDVSTLTKNEIYTGCYSAIQISYDNFSSCLIFKKRNSS